MVKLFIYFKRKMEERRLGRAIEKADWLAKKSGRKVLVLRYKNGFLVKTKSELSRLIRQKYFVKGFTIQRAEQMAVYIANR